MKVNYVKFGGEDKEKLLVAIGIGFVIIGSFIINVGLGFVILGIGCVAAAIASKEKL